MKKIRRSILLSLFAVLFLMTSAHAAVYLDEPKPRDWDNRDILRLYVFPTYQSDCMVLEAGGERMFIDGARITWHDLVAEALEKFGLTQVDYLFSSHPHPDHLQNMCWLLRSGALHGDLFITPYPQEYEYPYLQEMEEELARQEIPYYLMQNNEVLTMGRAMLQLMRYEEGIGENSTSGMLHIQFGDCSMLLTSDVDGNASQYFVERYGTQGLKADIMKAPHHGLLKVLPELVDAVAPDMVLITNDLGASEQQSLQYEKRGIPVVYNDPGILIIESDGYDWYITQLDGWDQETEDEEAREIW